MPHAIEEKHLQEAVQRSQSELQTVREVAQQLRVDDTTVRRWIKNGVLDAVALPHRGLRQAYRIRKATLDALLNTNAIAAVAE